MYNPEERALRDLDGVDSNEHEQGLQDLQNAKPIKQTTLGKVERIDYSKETVEETELKHGFFSVDIEEFPSKGRFYTDIPGVLHVKPMTGVEEQILATQRIVKKGKAIDAIFRNCFFAKSESVVPPR